MAAYIDGMLGPEKTARVTEHLAACADCYHVYSEVVTFLVESPVEPSARNVVPFREREREEKATNAPVPELKTASSRRWASASEGEAIASEEEKATNAPVSESPRRVFMRTRWLAAAALVVVGVGIGWLVFQTLLIERPELTTAELLPALQSERSVEDLVWSYAVHRGGLGDEEVMRQSFQVGALLVDFRLRAQAGEDLERAKETWRTVGRVVHEAPLMEAEGDRILNEANQIESVEDLRSLASRAPATEAALGGDDSVLFPDYMDFGKWTEAGRVSAKLQSPAFFQREENRQFLSYLLSWKGGREMALEPEVQELLQKIEQIWDGDPLDEKDFQTLAESFQAILDQYDFQPSVDDPF